MKKPFAVLLILLVGLSAVPRSLFAAPGKSAGPLEVTYYYLPT